MLWWNTVTNATCKYSLFGLIIPEVHEFLIREWRHGSWKFTSWSINMRQSHNKGSTLPPFGWKNSLQIEEFSLSKAFLYHFSTHKISSQMKNTPFFSLLIFYLHFKCYFLSWFPLQKPPIPSSLPCFYEGVPSTTHPLPPPCPRILLHFTGASSLHRTMGLSSHWCLTRLWVPPCLLFGWWFSPWEL